MAPKWREIAEMNIEKGDAIQKTFEGELDGKRGYLLVSKRRLLFVSEEGFMRKSYDLTMNMPLEKIRQVAMKGRYELNLTDDEGKRHDFKGSAVISTLESSIKELAHI